MSISKISGVLWENVSKLASTSRANIAKVGNKDVPSSITCKEINLAYGKDGASACGGRPETYYLDESTKTVMSMGTLYTTCGDRIAPIGFYSDGKEYWEWDGRDLTLGGNCRRR